MENDNIFFNMTRYFGFIKRVIRNRDQQVFYANLQLDPRNRRIRMYYFKI